MRYSVRQARAYAGLSQKEMAEKLNVHRSTYLKLEKHPDAITLRQARIISDTTGIPLDDIFFAAISN